MIKFTKFRGKIIKLTTLVASLKTCTGLQQYYFLASSLFSLLHYFQFSKAISTSEINEYIKIMIFLTSGKNGKFIRFKKTFVFILTTCMVFVFLPL